jgi:hypothetical protein
MTPNMIPKTSISTKNCPGLMSLQLALSDKISKCFWSKVMAIKGKDDPVLN